MKKDISLLAVSFPAFAFASVNAEINCFVPEIKKDASDQILDVIFAPDPFTRLPMNDVAVYLSNKVDPSIKEFVATQLLAPNPKTDGIIDDESDVLYDLVRHSDESVADYANRINGLIAQDNEFLSKSAELNKSSE